MLSVVIVILYFIIGYVTLKFALITKNNKVAICLHLLFILFAFLLMTHSLPGVHNLKVIDRHIFSSTSTPFTMYINFDKTLLAIIILSILGLGHGQLKYAIKWSIITLTVVSVVLIPMGLALSYIHWDPKLPAETGIWLFNNLFLVCTAEEAFFRKYIQSEIICKNSHFKKRPYFAIVIAAILFGLAHYKGGLVYIILSFIAGLSYGFAFFKSQRVEAAIFTHFGLNCLHFFFFSYPSLIKS
ncbi:MAG: CPBP family intramembrane metalloprotease [Bdellovibrionales bacterium]|nr:CPBP family intramembrane metalloprotease [Bdellovibrionales bacterium]